MIRTLTALPSDDRIREAVATRLFEEPGVSVAADAGGDPIRLLVDGGTVTLIGIVNTETARQTCRTHRARRQWSRQRPQQAAGRRNEI
jgi:hypothetical protein